MAKNDNELTKKVIDLCLINSIKESDLYIKFLSNQIKIYEKHLNYLEDTKPLFFQKKKLLEHSKKVEEYESKIKDLYIKIGQEVEEIEKMKETISI